MRFIFIILMLICIIYGVSIYMIGSGTMSFTIWLALGAFFGLAFYVSASGKWMEVPPLSRKVIYGIILTMTLFAVMCSIMMFSHFNDKGEIDLDYIIVLGAQMRKNGPSRIYQYRLDAAYEYMKNNPRTICIISGGKGHDEPVGEGIGGRDYLVAKGIDPSRIIAETEATDTIENIEYSLKLIDRKALGGDGKARIGIVTNSFHLFRGIHIAKKLTDDKICGIAAYSSPWYLPNNMARECFGILRDLGEMRF
ncbi:MAG: YdcF family protein [Butyrivibrio sp.]|nr:YdcF family protein [Butyrivibrio sp.]